MNLRTITSIIVLVAVVALVGWDVVAVVRGGYEATISSVVLAFGTAHPIVPFAAGVLCGHLFWPQSPGGHEPPAP